jgi:hypothetical protein
VDSLPVPSMTHALALLLALAFSAAAAATARPVTGGTVLDRLGDTEGVLGTPAADVPSDTPVEGRVCDGVETGSNGPCPPPTAPPVPVDGGLGLLAVAGAGYAARRLRAQRHRARPSRPDLD